MRSIHGISPSVINRIPKYLRCLEEIQGAGIERISSAQIAKTMGTTASQVRQDLSIFGTYGATGYGYQTATLVWEIKRILGLHKLHRIAVIGVGSIGKGLLEHMEFERFNYHVSAAFDIDDNIIGTTVNGVQVYDFSDFNEVISNEQIDICVLTVSKQSAKSVFRKLRESGIRSVWNFTGVDLSPAESILVQNVSLLDSLFVLTYHLEETNLTPGK